MHSRVKCNIHTVRFGVCEVYGNNSAGEAEVCANILRPGIDYVFIKNSFGSQNNTITLLNDNIQNVSNTSAIHGRDCMDLVFRAMCHYYLPPCDNTTHSLPPSSLCQEECTYVQTKCEDTWQAVKLAFSLNEFIDCADTSKLLFPLPNCCTGAGIEIEIPKPENTSTVTVVSMGSLLLYQPLYQTLALWYQEVQLQELV